MSEPSSLAKVGREYVDALLKHRPAPEHYSSARVELLEFVNDALKGFDDARKWTKSGQAPLPPIKRQEALQDTFSFCERAFGSKTPLKKIRAVLLAAKALLEQDPDTPRPKDQNSVVLLDVRAFFQAMEDVNKARMVQFLDTGP